MMAMRNTVPDEAPGEIEALLPWHAAGTLSARDTRRVDEALARDPGLARQYEVIREEYAETILLNESLGAPSSRAMQKLFAAIDAEPAQAGAGSPGLSSRLAGFFAGLSPRTVMASAAVGALALVLQAGLIGSIVMQREGTLPMAATPPTAQPAAPGNVTRSMAPEGSAAAETGPRVLVRFTPAARVSDITALLDTYQATIIEGGKAGLFRLQLGRLPMTREQVAGWIGRLQNEKIVSSVAAAP